MTAAVTLISPGPIDGYPPVQSQARLLASAGYAVTVVTTPMRDRARSDFSIDGVRVHDVRARRGRAGPMLERLGFLRAIATARRAEPRAHVEIAFDPDGMAVSDLAPRRPAHRIAHFHEMVTPARVRWPERRLPRALGRYDLVVVADAMRAPILQEQLALPQLPLVVPNYALRMDPLPASAKSAGFEVAFAGSIGTNQMLDLIVRSVALWPPQASLCLLGDADKPAAQPIRAMVTALGLASRVRFEGFIATAALPQRLARAHLGILLLDPVHDQFRYAAQASNKRYQYMQAGLPQLGNALPGIPELLEAQGIGCCVAALTPQAIAAAVAAYAADPARAAAEGARAEALHRSRYNYQAAFAPVLQWIAEHAR